jgi:hypothetical protein
MTTPECGSDDGYQRANPDQYRVHRDEAPTHYQLAAEIAGKYAEAGTEENQHDSSE